MSRDLKFLLQFVADDQASAKLAQMSKASERHSKAVAQQNKLTAQESVRANEKLGQSIVQMGQLSQKTTQRINDINKRMAQDRERLGIRTEDRIRREIALTEGAYKRLLQTGKLSANEQARAYDSMRNKVTALKKELHSTAQAQSRLSKGFSVGKSIAQGAMAVGAGVATAGYMLAQPVKKTMDYEQRLAYMANTAFAGEGLEAKKQGRETLRNAINEAAKYGGSKEEAAEALDTMIASGAISRDVAMAILPELHKAAIASNASTTEMANIAIRGMQNFGISEKDIPKMLDIATKAGEGGGFEIKDMARWLPELMAAAGMSGMSGLEDFKTIVTAAQTSLITGGSTDAAGNNLKNLLLKINSRDTARAAEKIEIAPGKSIDLSGSLAEAKNKGLNSLDAFVGIVDQVVGKDKRYQELQAKIKNSANKSPEQLQAMEQMSALLQGSAIGQLIQDQQALLALVGYMNNREYADTIKKDLEKAEGTNNENYASVADTAANKTERLANAKDHAEYDAFKGLSDVVGDVSLKLADYANQYPNLTVFLIRAGEALKTLAVAAGSAAVIGSILGKGARGGIFSRAFKPAAGATAAKAVTGAASKAGGGAFRGVSGKALGIVGAGMLAADTAMNVYDIAQSDMSGQEKTDAYLNVAKDTTATGVGIWGGAKVGGALGSFAGPLGAAIGGVVGGAIGAVAGPAAVDAVAESISGFFSSDPKPKSNKPNTFAPKFDSGTDTHYPSKDDILRVMQQKESQSPLDSQTLQMIEQSVQRAVEQARQTPQALNIHTTVDVQNGNITAAVNAINSQEARRY